MDITTESPRLTEHAFREEALRWLPSVARYARLLAGDSADAEDLTQETFLRACVNWTTFRPGTDCRKWLFAICRHLFLRTRERGERFVGVDDPEAEARRAAELFWEAESAGLEHLFHRIDLGPALEQAVRALPPDYRDVVIFVDVEGCAYADTAAALDLPIGTVRSRLFRARRLLQQTLMAHARDAGFAVAAFEADAGVLA
jgi:RNA polymerase sigma-70 factor (ECF subfamily)